MCFIMDACIHIYRGKGKVEKLITCETKSLGILLSDFCPFSAKGGWLISHPLEQ